MRPSRSYIAGMTTSAKLTADDLLHLNIPDKRTELVRGVLVVREPAGYRHGEVAGRIAKSVMDHVDRNDLGRVLAAETGFTLFTDPDTVRAPDVAFVSQARLPDPPPSGFAMLAPDLVVEVLSPDDRPGEVLAKIADWLRAGCKLVWVADSVRRQARVYRADGSEVMLSEADALDGEDVLPGLTIQLSAVL
jgi:Uma2 family endonuclease